MCCGLLKHVFQLVTVNIIYINMEAGLEAAVCWVNVYIMQHSNSFTSHLSCKYQQKLKYLDSLHGCSSLIGLPSSFEIHQTNQDAMVSVSIFYFYHIFTMSWGKLSSESHSGYFPSAFSSWEDLSEKM